MDFLCLFKVSYRKGGKTFAAAKPHNFMIDITLASLDWEQCLAV